MEPNKPLFTLTAEEVEVLSQIIAAAKFSYTKIYQSMRNTCLANDWQDAINQCNNLLTRIKQWQDDGNKS